MTDNQPGAAPVNQWAAWMAPAPPGSPSALVVIALGWLAADAGQARRIAALALAATRVPVDLADPGVTSTSLASTRPGQVARDFLAWLDPPGGPASDADAALRILTLAWACDQAPATVTPAQVLKAAQWLHRWFTAGRPRKPRDSSA
jgi:hypothetical protein